MRRRVRATVPHIRRDLTAASSVRVGDRPHREQVQASGSENPGELAEELSQLLLREHHVEGMGVDRVDRGPGRLPERREGVGPLEPKGLRNGLCPSALDGDRRVVDRPDVVAGRCERPRVAPGPATELEDGKVGPEPREVRKGPVEEPGRLSEESVGVPFVNRIRRGTPFRGGRPA